MKSDDAQKQTSALCGGLVSGNVSSSPSRNATKSGDVQKQTSASLVFVLRGNKSSSLSSNAMRSGDTQKQTSASRVVFWVITRPRLLQEML